MTSVRINDLSRLATAAGRLGLVEESGVLGGPGLLVVEPLSWDIDLEAAAAYVRDIPAVTLLAAAAWPDKAQALVDAFDLVTLDRAEIGAVERAVGLAPLGAYALVTLTRRSAGMSAADGIWAESAVFSALMGSRRYQEWLATKPASKERTEPAEAVLVEEAEGVLRLTLNRPAARNAVDLRLRDCLVAALETAELRPEVGIELRGAGVCFSAGGDLTEFGDADDPATAHAVRGTRHPALALARVADRVTAYAHGPSVGAGVELLAFARHVVAAPGATFRLPEVAMGLVPGAGGTWSVVQRMGRQRANWFMLTGATIDADTAHAWGLVDALA
ncbi:enoyl-CoA hydratase/isomerase family protein [Nocardioides sp. dk4132]|uniref:enoyl-CoA hydratase/isomerase family protein n=1 Tax=unclassified Nocardioides TaxID=2615069 RepID=UPI001295385B|nr:MULTISPECIES: enoyl-CoA hydratase/isomerase family protein [unclassified Nocardioides]MQW77621.1 enoyl-CoA hydratase/isomerase family protein [Nocardioides sp. dk4132]QGA06147.1 enoyl-CoA hydratase/isomerase family protein [Nocardioides sp. dk884]